MIISTVSYDASSVCINEISIVCAQCFNQQGTKLEVRSALNAVEHCYSVSQEEGEGVVLIRNGRQSMHQVPWQQLQKIWQTALFSA